MAAPRPCAISRGPFLALVILTLTTSPFGALSAQARPTPAVELAIEQQVRDRWMHGRQRPRFTRFASARTWLLVDSLRAGERGERRMYVTMGRSAAGRDSAMIVFATDGRVARLDAPLRPPARIPLLLPGDSARFARMRLFNQGRLTLPESRLWDLIPTFRTTRAKPGAHWTDTVAREAEHEGLRQAVRGVRVSTVVGDTTIGGHRLWVVRDSARVHYEERWLEDERTLDTLVTLTRTGDGVVRGRHLYDPEIGLFLTRDDTTVLSGEAVLRYPDSYPDVRSFRTPARYERVRHWDRYDQAGYAARVTELRASADRTSGGMVRIANTDVERRLAAGDSVARDSVVAEWQRSDDPDRRELAFGLVIRWPSRDSEFRKRLDSMRVAAGDSAYMYMLLAQQAFAAHEPTDTADLRRMFKFMADPGLAFSLDAGRDWLYENLQQALTTRPPAITHDTTRWPCTPTACRMLADQWRSAREPRLRELGLVAHLTLEPGRWADTVLARAQAGTHFLAPAAMLARGVGATWPAASKASLPEPNATWQAWAEWMNGVDPRYAAALASMQPPGPRREPRPESRVRFEESHVTAIRFIQARTGRDVIGELRRSFASAPDDSARLVFGAMVQGLGELPLTPDEVAAYFRSGDAARLRIAQTALLGLFRKEAGLADSVTALALLDRLVSLAVEGVPAWRSLDGTPLGWASRGPELHGAPRRDVYFLLGDSMPQALQQRWKGRIGIVSSTEWGSQPPTQPGVLYTLSGVRRVGPFVLVGVSALERAARREGETPRVFAAGVRYFLMERAGEWVVVASDQWVT
jgi:hypothetical protein